VHFLQISAHTGHFTLCWQFEHWWFS